MTDTALSAEKIEALFTYPDGEYRFARWNRPIVPIVFGVDDETLTHLKSAIVTTVGVTNWARISCGSFAKTGTNCWVFPT